MSKGKYKINPHTLEFERVRLRGKELLRHGSFSIIGGLVFAATMILIAYNFFDSPKELTLKRENRQYELQIELMNKRLDLMSKVLKDIEERDDNIYRTIFEAEPVPIDERRAGIGGVDRYAELKGYENSDLIIETTKRIDQLSRELYIQSKSFDKVYKLAKSKSKMLASIPGIQPITNKDFTRIVSGFGYRMHPIYKTMRMHTGIDFSAPIGTPIYATGDGKVAYPSEDLGGYGLVVEINHGYGYQTLYAHMSKIIVKPGQIVKRGEIIGYVGNTGRSTGPHLHYEVRKNGKPIDPVNFFYQDLSPEEYKKIIEISSRPTQSMS
jgi:murein DD-endopeptidase MepM/ murein hydrolase activator NlpD